MQSSTMVALRTMVMVTCLVAVPLAAVISTALPKVLKSAWQGQSAALSPQTGASGMAHEDEPPPLTHAPLLADEPPPASSMASADEPPPVPAMPVARITAVRPASARPVATITDVRPVSPDAIAQTAPLWNASPRTARSSATRQTTAHSLAARPLLKTDYSPPPPQTIRAPAADDAPLASLERPAGPNDSFARSERRLRELGATHYRLEIWGSQSELYRCTCNIPLRPRSPAARHFESVEPAPSAAIDAVIRQVEHWRAEQRR
ncbi:MAG TPA: hypothetical protein VFW87_13390 [Pirellulales bacterium]|nr:hypothetical protein [Pirellulales bacterium]